MIKIASPAIGEEEVKAVEAVLRSGMIASGPKVKELEKNFADYIGVKHAIAVSNGTTALHAALLALSLKEGDEVITTPFSFVASANAILYVGAKPIFADIDPLTYNIDPQKIERAITKRTKAILVVHIFGQPAEMAPILKIARKYNLKIIEDACESLGATYKGRMAGTFGESAVFAFYANKQMTTGEGGVIVTSNKRIYGLCRSLRNQGRAENMQWLDHNRLGYNYRMDEMSAAVGLAQIENIDFLLRERSIADWYHEFLAPHGDLIQTPQTHPHNTHTWQVYVVRIKNRNINRDRVMLDLQKQGIATKPYLPSIHLFSFYRSRFGFKPGDYPISETVSASTLALPFYVGLKRPDIKYISNKVIDAVKKYN